MSDPVPATDDERRLLCRLLMDGSEVPSGTMGVARHASGVTFVSVPDLCDWLTKLSEAAVSDQKQEAYRGIREYIRILVRLP